MLSEQFLLVQHYLLCMMTKEWKHDYNIKWYKKNKTARRKQIKERRNSLIKWYNEYKSELKCSKCLENHPAFLQFHHLDPKIKEIIPSRAFTVQGWSIKRFLKEISSCVVLCANCHAKHHWDEKH